MIKVSVIVPVFNGELYIQKCVESLLKQTLKEIEIIVVNDGSTDNTLNIVSQYQDSRLKVISIKNQGQGKARNIGVQEAKGRYLGFVDSDDYIKEDMFEELYECANKKQADLVICPYHRVDINGNILFTEMLNCNQDYLNINTSPWNKLFLKSKWEEYEIKFAENLWYEDLQAIVCYLSICQKVEWMNKPLYYYVQRENSSINKFNEKVEDIFLVFDNITEFLSTHRLNISHDVIEYYYIMHLVFGHLSRCAIESSFIKRHQLIINTKKYLEYSLPNYKKNRNFNFITMSTKPLGMFLIKYVGFKMFKLGCYDLVLWSYHMKLKVNSNIKRW
ncbi:glycosyltransferase family 2 protein [Turicibacter sanguinis]|uniref:glycosyltransferase family 2 protein n=1 Tax=Turicibacter sanguinis TaxID=154288 RepID=UPI0018A88DEB|nr:glycosyltransferase family 2 protein [Turicibacter sanguinis]